MKKLIICVCLIMGISVAKAQYSDSVKVSHLAKVMVVFNEPIEGNAVPGSAVVNVIKVDDKTLLLEANAEKIGAIVNAGRSVPPTNLLVTAGRSYYNFFVSYSRELDRHLVSPEMYKPIYTSTAPIEASNGSKRLANTSSNKLSYDNPDTFLGDDLLSELDSAKEKIIYGGRYGDVKLFYAATNLWVDEEKLYVRIKVKNESSTPYNIEYFRFFISDTKWSTSKKNTPRLTDVEPLDKLRDIQISVEGESEYTNVFVFKRFSLYDKQNFNIQIGEVNGGRKATLSMTRKEMFIAENLE